MTAWPKALLAVVAVASTAPTGCGASGQPTAGPPAPVEASLGPDAGVVEGGQDAREDAARSADAADPSSDHAAPDAAIAPDASSDRPTATDAASDAGADGPGVVAGGARLASVAGAAGASSPGFSIRMTTGQSPGGNTTMASPAFRMTTGVVAAHP